jgi:hypothetical protein
MFHRLLHLRKNDEGDAKGAVLIGQPGIGASLSLGLRPAPREISLVHAFFRKNYLPKVHARAADFCSPGRTPV